MEMSLKRMDNPFFTAYTHEGIYGRVSVSAAVDTDIFYITESNKDKNIPTQFK